MIRPTYGGGCRCRTRWDIQHGPQPRAPQITAIQVIDDAQSICRGWNIPDYWVCVARAATCQRHGSC